MQDPLNAASGPRVFIYLVFFWKPPKKSHFVDKILFFTVDQIMKGSDLKKEVIVFGNKTKDAFSTKQFTGL